MASLGKIPVFSGEDYAYWKVRMRAFLQSMGAEVWEITKNQLYEVLAVRTTPLQVTDRKSTRLNSSHHTTSRMPSSA